MRIVVLGEVPSLLLFLLWLPIDRWSSSAEAGVVFAPGRAVVPSLRSVASCQS